jgi:tetratricopeptide (TPR) repeat protein
MSKIIDVIRNLEKDINNQGLLIEFTEPMTIEQVREVEAKFDFTFPEDYTSFITTHGLIGFRNEKSEEAMCDMLAPWEITEDMEFVLDAEGEWSGNLVIFQKFDLIDRFDFYAFRRTGNTIDVVSYFDDGAAINAVAATFTEHLELLLKSMKGRGDNIDAFDAEEQTRADKAAMLATFQQAGQFFKKYNDKESLLKAVELYDEVLTWFTSGKVVDDHIFLNTHYLKSRAYVYLNAYCKQQYAAEELNELKRMIIEQSRYTLSLMPPSTDLPYYKEIVRACSNSVAWNMAELATGNNELEKALTILQQGIDLIEMPEQFFLYDTQVRILLKLGHKEEAYRIVRNVLTLLPDFSDFQDIKQEANYKNWLQN